MDNNGQNNITQPVSEKEPPASKRESKTQARVAAAKKRQAKRVFTWIIAVLVIVGAGYGVTKIGTGDVAVDGGALPDTDQVTERDNVKGNTDARVTVVEYSDFQCPACAAYFPMVTRLHEEFGSQIQIVYRHFPLVSIHPYAALAARAAEAAGRQGKFWEMHDLLFENQSDWSASSARDKIFGYAESLGLDMAQFEADIESEAVSDKISDDLASGKRAGVTGTPSFYINGEKVPNPRSYNDFAEYVRTELAAEDNGTAGMMPAGTEMRPEDSEAAE